MTKPVIELVVDSGAYSAFTMGKEINLKEYIEFVKTNEKSISHVVNLDVINPEDPNVAAAAGWKNFLEMRDAGVSTVPVFHAREQLKWLTQMLEATDYIGLSGTSLVSPVEVKHFYDICWQYVTDKNGYPIAKFHSFGDTSPHTLLNYPFYSADSATWMIQAGRAARIKLQGKSIQLRSAKIRDTSYISNDDTGPKRQSWEREITALGLDPERVMNVKASQSELAMMRSYLVAAELLQLEARSACCSYYKKPGSLIKTKKQQEGGAKREGPCKVIFVLSPSAYYFNLPLITILGIKRVLVSYYYVADAPAKFWPERLEPFLYDPIGFCQNNPKVKRYYDKMQEFMLKPVEVTA